MTRRLPLLAASALAAALLLSLAACGGDDDDTSDGDATSQTSDPADGGEATAPDEAENGAAPAGGVALADITADAVAVTIGPDGFEPGDATIAVGEVVEFTAADDGLYSVIVGDLDGYTVGSGLVEYFRFDQPGSYPVTEDLSGAPMTINVE
ncbi:hypothetical protein BH09ACT12_BH09ACT12_04920 [soil metagenome]